MTILASDVCARAHKEYLFAQKAAEDQTEEAIMWKQCLKYTFM